VTKIMTNLWPFYIKRWRWQIPFCDDINLSSMTIPKRWRQLPHHCWRHRHGSCHIFADVSTTSDANAVNGRLWRKRIVTKSLMALTATSVSQADVKLWRKQGIIYDKKNVCHRMNLNPWRHKIRHRLETHLWRKNQFRHRWTNVTPP
jgi:hypothetical protein